MRKKNKESKCLFDAKSKFAVSSQKRCLLLSEVNEVM